MSQATLSASENATEEARTVSTNWSIGQLISGGAKTWQLSQGTVLLICFLPLLVALFAFAMALIGKDAYKWFTGEDRFAENLQVIFWAISFLLSLIIVKKKLRDGDNMFAVLYAILAVGIFFIIGEEVSWGQRVFGWMTPESLQAINKQKETNIHNIHGIGTTFKWAHMVVGAYGTFLPIIVMRSKALSRFSSQISMLVPHYTLVPYFAFLLFWRIFRNLFEVPKKYYFAVSEFSEVTELVLSLAFLFFLIFQIRQARKKRFHLARPNGL